MSDVPLWIQTLQALATPVIGATVGVVAFMQWRTAHQKVVLDLFERRIAVYELVKSAVKIVNTSGASGPDAESNLLTAMNRAEFLFGEDVRKYLDELWWHYVNLQAATSEMADLRRGNERTAVVKRRAEHLKGIISFYKDSSPIFARYMRMDQKLVPTPTEWFLDRNRKRLSYTDEKQK